MKRLSVLLVLVCAACAGPNPTEPDGTPSSVSTATSNVSPSPTPVPWPTPYPERADRPPIYALIHLWYTAVPERCGMPGGAAGGWGPWVWEGRIDDPCARIPGAPWLRQISSNAYPLIGAYQSNDEEVMRWQIRQAKAAGIDGFFAGVYSWALHLRGVFNTFFGDPTTGRKGLLQIAHEEHFKVGLEIWGPTEAYRGVWLQEVARMQATLETSPWRDAYIEIGGKPAFWLIYPEWMTEHEQMLFFDGTPDQPHSYTWLLRGRVPLGVVVDLNRQLRSSRLQYVSWSVRPTRSGWYHNPGFADDQYRVLNEVPPELGMIPIAHAYTGYDERAGTFPGEYQGRFGLRNGITFIKNFLESAVQYGAKIILCESWNEYGEGSMLEAALSVIFWRNMGQEADLYLDDQGNLDPFRYLKIFSEFNGMQEWVPPRPPSCAIIDPRLRSEGAPPIGMQCVNADGQLEPAW